MAPKHTKKTAGRRIQKKTMKKGGGYGFGGSVLSNVGGPNAGNALWSPNSGSDCGPGFENRGGNNTLAGGRRRRHHKSKKTASRRLRKYRGGSNTVVNNGSTVALQQPRTGYTFNGSGVAGTADTVPVGSPVTYV